MQQTDTSGNLYHNDGEQKYVRINGVYYESTVQEGWMVVAPEALPLNIAWIPLPATMLAAFEPELPN